MLLIEDKLIGDDVMADQFACDLARCKGACCWEGDYGAPLEEAEVATIRSIYSKLEHLLAKDSRDQIEKTGLFGQHPETNGKVTALMDDGACVFLTKDALGIARCSFEQANQMGITDFVKPISCHLYPLRITENRLTGFEAINYDRWDICSPACTRGKKLGIPVFRFVRDALVRKYGTSFYEKMEAIYAQNGESDAG